jgi:nucleoside-diphosphate-sugar epimerase
MDNNPKSEVVAITGITGYLATEIAHQLLSKGYTVHGTVRSLSSDSAKDIQQLFPTVKLFEADLLKEGSFDKAFEGVSVVIHTASPFLMKWNDPQTDLVDPALNGTKNVLASVSRYPAITRVVITGSCAAVVEHYPSDDGTKTWTEEDWNTTSSLKEGPYRLSKVLAERAAFEWAEKHHHVRLTSILPTFIIGPPLNKRADATSIKVVKNILDGTYKAEGGVAASAFGSVDVRDVALAHIRAFERPEAKGRFILSSEKGVSRLSFCKVLKQEFPKLPIPEIETGELKYVGGNVINGKYSHAKAEKDLGIVFTPYEKSIVEMAKKMIELGIVDPSQAH